MKKAGKPEQSYYSKGDTANLEIFHIASSLKNRITKKRETVIVRMRTSCRYTSSPS